MQSISLVQDGMGILVASEWPAETFVIKLIEKLKEVKEVDLICDAPPLPCDRYDSFVPEVLLKKAFVYDHLDIAGVSQWAISIQDNYKL